MAQRLSFEQLMREASIKRRGEPVLVGGWDDGGGRVPWYSARCGPEEVALRDKCRVIFGIKERAPDPALEERYRKLQPKAKPGLHHQPKRGRR